MKYWLVQRLSRQDYVGSRTGFDATFGLEYMGSAEYEFSTPNESLRRMRSLPVVVFHHELESCKGEPLKEPRHIFFVAHKEKLLDKITDFEKWLENPKCKESTYFPENLTGVDWRGEPIDDFYKRTVAWWSFTDDIAWTLDPEVAGFLATSFLPKK